MTLRALAPVLLLLLLLRAAPAHAVDKLDQSDWGDICINDQSTWERSRPYSANAIDKGNCRILRRGGRDKRDRRFVVVVPRRALRRATTPVVYFFHGTSGTGEQYWNISRWRELAHREGFIAVFATSLAYDLTENPGRRRTRVWNIIGQTCDVARSALLADDVAFVRAIHADLDRHLNLDDRRIYASGFSNGGEMTHRLAHEAGDLFAATAAWGAIPAEPCRTHPITASSAPIPVWAGVGNQDDRYGFDTRELELTAPEIQNRLQPWWFNVTALLYSVSATYSRELAIDDFVTLPPLPAGATQPVFSPVLQFDPQPGNPHGNEYYFVTLDENGHKYPNAWPGQPSENSRNVSMALLQAQFFLDNPKP